MGAQLGARLRCDSLGEDLSVLTATVDEGLSQLTTAIISLIAPGLLDDDALGEPATLEILDDDAVVRCFPLRLRALQLMQIQGEGRARYRVELCHELALLDLRSDVRMFQEKDAMAIVDEVIASAGLSASHYSKSLQRTLSERVYCVQYRETDLCFIERLLEHEGIFYAIEDDGAETAVTFADNGSALSPIEGDTAVMARPELTHGPGIHDLTFETSVVSQTVSLGDYNHDTPTLELGRTESTTSDYSSGDWYEYTAGYLTPEEGDTLAKIRCEEIDAGRVIGRGTSNVPRFRAGRWFELEGTDQTRLHQKYRLVTVQHHYAVHDADAREGGASYHNTFSCMPEVTPYRPPRRRRAPRLTASHSMVVTGPSGAEIHTDELGRMKGKYYWDRLGAQDDTSSCWMRVVQFPIGESMALARVGWEMLSLHFDGDPDRPIGVSRMYTASGPSPYSYPAAGTRMAFQTPSSPASGKSNELRMEDGGGGMEMFVNASKDAQIKTINNKTEKIGVDETQEVGVDSGVDVGAAQSVTIGGNETSTVSGQQSINVQASRTKSVGGSETVSVSGGIKIGVKGSDSETTGGTHMTLAALGIDRTATGGECLTVGGSMISAAGLGVGLAVAGAKAETVGGVKVVASGASVTESVYGALASTVGGAQVQAAGGNRIGNTKGVSALTVGGLLAANAAGNITLKSKKVTIRVLGVANFIGGGGTLTLTPASASMLGIVTLDASGSVKISGNPNLVG
ncbi:MAG: type VI secretion system tip protein TssI/VgrG [Polyangiaceae bacterium]